MEATLIEQLIGLYERGEHEAALNLAIALTEQGVLSTEWAGHVACVLIDVGGALRKEECVQTGLETFLRISDSGSDEQSRIMALYNASNGEGALAQIRADREGRQGMMQAFRNQRGLLQRVLLSPGFGASSIREDAITNYANTLESLGRTGEAIDHYSRCLSSKPNHAIALGNCGRAHFNLLNVDYRHNTRLLLESLFLHQEAIAHSQELIEIGGFHAVSEYRESLARIEAFIEQNLEGGVVWATAARQESLKAHPNFEPDEIERQSLNDRLVLTVNPLAFTCPTMVRDDLFIARFSTKGGKSGISRASFIIDTFNQIKEDFVTARHLYYASQSTQEIMLKESSATHYGSSPSSAEFNLRCGLLKASFRLAADALYKVAWFLNGYMELQIPKRRVNFVSLWYDGQDSKRSLKPVFLREIEECKHMRGLFETSQTFREFPGPLKDLRNDATHSVLLLFGPASNPHLHESLSGKVATLNFRDLTLEALRMLKGAIICLVGYVAFNEARKDGVDYGIQFEYGVSRSDLEAGA